MSHFDVSLRRGIFLIRRCVSHFVAAYIFDLFVAACTRFPVRASLRCVTLSRRFVSSLCHFVAVFRLFVAA
jgi:hypothetical protein